MKSDISPLTELQNERKEIYRGRVVNLVCDTVTLPNGKQTTREVCLHIGAVAIIPVLDDGRVIMERQFRYPHGRVLLEIPAGKLNYPDEDALDAAKRELREETGAIAKSYTDLGYMLPSPAILSEKIKIYLARDISFTERELDEDEFLDLEFIPLSDLRDMVMRGEIEDAKTQIAVLKAFSLTNGEAEKL